MRAANEVPPYAITDAFRDVLRGAREQAESRGQQSVRPEHVLLSLLSLQGGRAVDALAALKVDRRQLIDAAQDLVGGGRQRGTSHAPRNVPLDPSTNEVIRAAVEAGRSDGDGEVGTLDLLVGLCTPAGGSTADLLAAAGVTERVLRGGDPDRSDHPQGGAAGRDRFRIDIDDAAELSIYEQIVGRVREAVATGELAGGERLPPVRRLADALDIAPGTVARAYSELERLGVVETAGARGTRVARARRPLDEVARSDTLVGLLRPVAVAAFHLGAEADELRASLERALEGIYEG